MRRRMLQVQTRNGRHLLALWSLLGHARTSMFFAKSKHEQTVVSVWLPRRFLLWSHTNAPAQKSAKFNLRGHTIEMIENMNIRSLQNIYILSQLT